MDAPLRSLILIAILAVSFGGSGCRPKTMGPKVDYTFQKVAFQIGETTVHAHVTLAGDDRTTMISLHEDEQTAVAAARVILEKRGGRLIQLVHNGSRRVNFAWQGSTYNFDPNRIFSPQGVAATLKGPDPQSLEARSVAGAFADQFIDYFRLRSERCLIALHNNGEGGLSIASFIPGGPSATDAADCFANASADPDDFFYVTDARLFRELSAKQFNVMLQDNHRVHDDGSLSVFAGRYGIPYINVEAQDGHLNEQIRMLEAAVEVAVTR